MKILIPSSLRNYTDGVKHWTTDAKDVAESLDHLVQAFPNLRDQLFNNHGELVSHLNVFVNETNLRDLRGLATPVTDRDEVVLVPALAGG